LKATVTAQQHLKQIAKGPADGGPETNPDNHGALKMANAQRVAEENKKFFYWPEPSGTVKQPDVHCYAKNCSYGKSFQDSCDWCCL
jgi:hypothetical protein